MSEYGLGALPSPPDAGRDVLLTASAIQAAAAGLVLPDRFLTAGMPPHLNQGGTPQCTTHAGNQLKRWQEKRDGHGVRLYDQARMYAWQKQVDGIPGAGSTGYAWCQVAATRGIPLRGMTTGVDPIAGFWRVDIGGDWDALRAAILVFGPVMIGGEYPASWMPHAAMRGIAPVPSGGIVGGHERLVVGWDWHHPTAKDPALLEWGSWGNFPGSTGGGNLWIPVKHLSRDGAGATVAVWELWKTRDRKGD